MTLQPLQLACLHACGCMIGACYAQRKPFVQQKQLAVSWWRQRGTRIAGWLVAPWCDGWLLPIGRGRRGGMGSFKASSALPLVHRVAGQQDRAMTSMSSAVCEPMTISAAACLAGAAAAPVAQTLPSACASPFLTALCPLLELCIMSAAILAQLRSLQRDFGRPCGSEAAAEKLVRDAQEFQTVCCSPGTEPRAVTAFVR